MAELQCPVCSKKCAHHFTLRRHLSHKHKNVEVNFKCGQCVNLQSPDYVVIKNHLRFAHKIKQIDFNENVVIVVPQQVAVEEANSKPNAVTTLLGHISLELSTRFQLGEEGVQYLVDSVDQVVKTALELDETVEHSLVGTKSRRSSFYKQIFMYVSPQEVVLGVKSQFLNGQTQKVIKHKGYFVPLAESLSMFLNLPQYQKYCNLTSAEWNDNSKGVYASEPGCIAPTIFIAASFDEIEVVNPLGQGTKKHKCMIGLYEVLNIPPSLRSPLQTKGLIFCSKSANLKSDVGFKNILHDFVETLIAGQSGISLGPLQQKYFLKSVYVTADTPANNFMFGFKISVSKTLQFCRTCWCTQDERATKFDDRSFDKRVEEQHLQQLIEIESADKICAEGLKSKYGIIRRTPLLDIPGFEIGMAVHDPMHVLLEGGVLAISLQCLLHDLILVQKRFSLAQLNNVLETWQFSNEDRGDRPPKFIRKYLEPNNPMNLKAMSLYVLCQDILLIISPWVEENCEIVLNFARILVISQFILFAPEYSSDSLGMLRVLIYNHHYKFCNLHPSVRMTPKFHYLLHFVDQILKYGPSRYQSCMRYEAHYSIFKRKWKSFKNIPYSLAFFHQKWHCRYLTDKTGKVSTQFLNEETKRSGEVPFKRWLVPHRFHHLINLDEITSVCNEISIGKCVYTEGSVLEISAPSDDYPLFGVIVMFVCAENTISICFDTFTSATFIPTMACYEVDGSVPSVTAVGEIPYLLACPKRIVQSKSYVVRKFGSRLPYI